MQFLSLFTYRVLGPLLNAGAAHGLWFFGGIGGLIYHAMLPFGMHGLVPWLSRICLNLFWVVLI